MGEMARRCRCCELLIPGHIMYGSTLRLIAECCTLLKG